MNGIIMDQVVLQNYEGIDDMKTSGTDEIELVRENKLSSDSGIVVVGFYTFLICEYFLLNTIQQEHKALSNIQWTII